MVGFFFPTRINYRLLYCWFFFWYHLASKAVDEVATKIGFKDSHFCRDFVINKNKFVLYEIRSFATNKVYSNMLKVANLNIKCLLVHVNRYRFRVRIFLMPLSPKLKKKRYVELISPGHVRTQQTTCFFPQNRGEGVINATIKPPPQFLLRLLIFSTEPYND